MSIIDFLCIAIIGLTIYLCVEGFIALTRREKETLALLDKLERGERKLITCASNFVAALASVYR